MKMYRVVLLQYLDIMAHDEDEASDVGMLLASDVGDVEVLEVAYIAGADDELVESDEQE